MIIAAARNQYGDTVKVEKTESRIGKLVIFGWKILGGSFLNKIHPNYPSIEEELIRKGYRVISQTKTNAGIPKLKSYPCKSIMPS